MTDRRKFIKAAALTAASYSRILGANDRIRIGGIGTGGRCQYVLSLLNKTSNAQIVALCDVYQPHLDEATKKLAPEATQFNDYRKVLELPDVDAVVIGTPDHWHVPIAIAAVGAGKDVYVEKPVTHHIEEGEPLIQAVAESKRIVQTGMQQRSWPHFQQARDIVASGALGQVALIRTYWYQNYLLGRDKPKPIDTSKLDWKMFLGAAPDQPFDAERYRNWRWFWDFGGGSLTDLFLHWVDVAHWCMSSDTPIDAQAAGGKYLIPEFQWPDTVNAALHYPGNFMVTFDCSLLGYLEGGGLMFHGTKALMRLHRSGFAVYPEQTRYTELPDLKNVTEEVQSTHDGTIEHVQNFLDCIRSRNTPNAPVAVGVAAARAGHLGNQALRTGQTVRA
ncbi:MAG: Gfo/Idh/MocA family protein [Bryobacteraceae bacterium]